MCHYIHCNETLYYIVVIWMLLAWKVLNVWWAFIIDRTNLGLINWNILGFKNKKMITTNSSCFLSFINLRLEVSTLFGCCKIKLIIWVNLKISWFKALALSCYQFRFLKFYTFNRSYLWNYFVTWDLWLYFFLKTCTVYFILFTKVNICIWNKAISITANYNMTHRINCM
jgi:hypothetical protein